MRYKRVRERLVFQTPWTLVYDDDILHPDGRPGTYTRVTPNGADGGSHVIPRLPDGRVLLIKANRYPAGIDVWEFPRGGPHVGESYEDAARRELFEEAGLRASSLKFLGILYPDSAILGSHHHVYMADVPAEAERQVKVDSSEGGLEHIWIEPDRLGTLHARGDIIDGTALADLMLLQMH
jgi:8-oxo-dGTP pyrophosphatase MutT (NUDIX family)